MTELVAAGLFGLIGGLLRALVGILKNYRMKKQKRFKPLYLIVTLLISAAIGTTASLALSTNYLMNLVVGYAGIDLLENMLKIVTKKN